MINQTTICIIILVILISLFICRENFASISSQTALCNKCGGEITNNTCNLNPSCPRNYKYYNYYGIKICGDNPTTNDPCPSGLKLTNDNDYKCFPKIIANTGPTPNTVVFSCPNGLIYDNNRNICKLKNQDSKFECPSGFTVDDKNDTPGCIPTPILKNSISNINSNGNNYSCPNGFIYDKDQQKCIKDQCLGTNGTKYNRTTKFCENNSISPCPSGFTLIGDKCKLQDPNKVSC